jgi:hypothetical protein
MKSNLGDRRGSEPANHKSTPSSTPKKQAKTMATSRKLSTNKIYLSVHTQTKNLKQK